ncbi:hypothetical protein LA03_10235 [Burkholderia gladioli]|nr:hypothetical protein LA03_10235 [Burkholderia gladioli]
MAVVFGGQCEVPTQYCPGAHIEDNKQPHALKFDVFFQSDRIRDANAQADIQFMAVELNHFERTCDQWP